MSFLKKLFGGKNEEQKSVSLKAFATGKVVPIEEVPDPVFSEKMMGDGLAIEPTEGKVVSPIDGEIIQVFPTKHAVGIKAQNGAEILIHIGLETVSMKGEGFTTHVSEGQKVQTGDVLVTFDLDLIKEKAKSTITPLVITNTADLASVDQHQAGDVQAGEETILTVKAN